jgi:membrane dipeptidase
MGSITGERRPTTAAVRSLFADTLVWDNHCCTTITPGRPEWTAELRRVRDSGIDVVGLNIGFDAAPPEHAIVLLAELRRWLKGHPEHYALVGSVAEIEQARRNGRLAVFFNIEGGNALQGNASLVSLFYELGVRWMLFAYNRNNALCGGCLEVDTGLTDFGREVMDEMERVGMLVCCSHIGERSAMEIMSRATRPVIYSHSNPAAVWAHPRNISDAAMRECARTGGVVGINGIGIFLGDNDASPELIVRHIDYAVQLIGPEHVGIGLDYVFDQEEVKSFVRARPESFPPDKFPNGIAMAEPECLPRIAELLLQRGYAERDLRNILGGNFLRVARQVWK